VHGTARGVTINEDLLANISARFEPPTVACITTRSKFLPSDIANNVAYLRILIACQSEPMNIIP